MSLLKKALLSFLPLILLLLLSSKVDASDSISSWNNTTALPVEIASHTIYPFLDKLIIAGGANTSVLNLNITSTTSSSGQLSNWTASSINSPTILWHTAAQRGNKVYMIGGSTAVGIIPYVYLGNINATGIVDDWSLITNLPKSLAFTGASIINNRLYVSGGLDQNGVVSQNIYFAEIDANGLLGNWVDAGNMPMAMYAHGFIEDNGYFYEIGGRNSSHQILNTVYRQKINADGSVGTGEILNLLPIGIARGGIVKVGRTIYSIGGDSSIGITDTVLSSEIQTDNSLGAWEPSVHPLPKKLCCGAAANIGDYIYYTGGHDGAGYFDSVYYTKIIGDEPENEILLAVPLLKQTAQPWEDDVYDMATIWSPANPTINRWGCALTSATMILNYYGLQKIDASTNLTPETLNNWLKTQPDGYVNGGLLNWLAISRLTKNSKSFNPAFSYDALEYRRVSGMDNTQLDTDLSASQPDILEVPGHFIVAKGKTDSSYLINDPFYERDSLDDEYENSYVSLGRYIPSHTDLSYIQIISNPELNIELKDQNGSVPVENFIQSPISNPVTGQPSGDPVRIVYKPQPLGGNYQIALSASSPTPYKLEVFIYDTQGRVKIFTFTGTVDSSSQIIYPLNFDKTTAANSTVKKVVSFADFYRDLKTLYDTRKINVITYLLLTAGIKDIENDYKKGKITQAVKKIDLFRLVITKLSKKDADDPVKKLLLEDLDGLRSYVRG